VECFDGGAGCLGPALPKLERARRPAIKLFVFPGLPPEAWDKFQNTDAGRQLIKEADDLLEQKDKLEAEIREIRFSPNAAGRQEELIPKIKKAEEVQKKIGDLQPRAEKVIATFKFIAAPDTQTPPAPQ
jgi:hypothetical protein